MKIPQRVKLAVQEYRSDEDTVGRFVKDRIEEAASEVTVSKSEVYAAYKERSDEEGHRWLFTKARFTRRLKEQVFHDEEKTWRGIQIKEN
jgi:phage/plasmid-associated DNA primase